jgi:uncharacterized protein
MSVIRRMVGTWLGGPGNTSADPARGDRQRDKPLASPGDDHPAQGQGGFLLGAVTAAARGCETAAAAVLIGLVIVYQTAVSPLLGRHCRFTPSCSAYFRQAVEKYGPVRGTLKGFARISRCHPWRPGGYDPP